MKLVEDEAEEDLNSVQTGALHAFTHAFCELMKTDRICVGCRHS